MDDQERRKVQEFLIQQQSGMFSASAAYTNLITIGGYAGSFTIWSFIKDFLSTDASLWIAVLLAISLIVFVSWNVHQMIWIALERFKYVNALQGLSGQDFINKYVALEEQTKASTFGWVIKLWIAMLVITIATGYMAFLLLFVNCATLLLGFSGWP